MRIAAVLLSCCAAATARAEATLGAALELTHGLAGASEPGLALEVAPAPFLELEVGAIRHDVDGDPFAGGDDHQAWILTGAARGRLALGRYAALVGGLGVMGGEHGTRNGCFSRGFLDFCGARNDTLVYRHWAPALWLAPELGGEVAAGFLAARLTLAPLLQLARPDEEQGCLSCDDGSQGLFIALSVRARIPG